MTTTCLLKQCKCKNIECECICHEFRIMIKIITGGFERTLKKVTRVFMWTKSGYIEIPKYRNVE